MRKWERAKRDRREEQRGRRRRPTRYQLGYRWGAAVAAEVRGYRTYWRAQLVSLAMVAAGLLLGGWVVLRLRFAATFAEAVAVAGAYTAVKLAVQELGLHLPNVFKVGVSRRAAFGRWLKEAGIAILPDAIAAALAVYFGTWSWFAFGVYLAYLVSRFTYAVLFDADHFDSKAGGIVNALLGAILIGAWWWAGTLYLAGG
jgi:hypothetical protein